MKLLVIAFVVLVPSRSALAGPTAEDLYGEGQSAYDRGDYATAIAKWQRSYDMSRASGLLFNLAQAYRLSGDCAHALTTYKHFIAIDSTSEQRPLADELVGELEPKCGPPPPSHVDQAPRRLDPTHTGHGMKLAGLATSGTGVALVAGGLVLGKHASTLGDEVTSACAVSCDWSMQKDKDAAGHRDTTIARVLDGVGVAAIATGVTLYALGVRQADLQLVVQPTPDGAVVTWSGNW